MALAIAYDDVKIKQTKNKFGSIQTPYFRFRDNPDLPHASLNQHEQGYFIGTHFHVVDQFQVVIDGAGTLGRHELIPYYIHFARAYTPYGPIKAIAGDGLDFFVMRAHWDGGGHPLPQELDQLKQVPDRQPWQVSSRVTFPPLRTGTAAADTLLQAVPGIKDEQGLAAYTLSMKPNAKACAPDPSHGDGQYVLVLKGSLLHNNKEHKTWTLVFIEPNEDAFQIHAGSGGLEALILNYPQVKPRTVHWKPSPISTRSKKWKCAQCGFVYDEALGLPEEGIAAGTHWEDVPETWSCPDCSATKGDFQMVEL